MSATKPPLQDCALYLVVDGPGEIIIQDGAIRISRPLVAGMLILARYDTPTTFTTDASTRMRAIAFPRRRVDAFALNMGLEPEAISTEAFFDPCIRQLVDRIHGLSIALREVDEVMESLVQCLIALLCGRSSQRTQQQPVLTTFNESMLQEVLQYVEACVDRRLTLKKLAGRVGLSESHFSRMFRAATGPSPHQYVVERRIHRAQIMLVEDTAPLSEIAYACGFSSQSHMTDVFRNRLGCSPGRYRREHRVSV